ncbi:hypothetical protein Lal_00044992 [Lupinus albus]|nr:hypothetical protein Lal_00044992 [Lupinus albus]
MPLLKRLLVVKNARARDRRHRPQDPRGAPARWAHHRPGSRGAGRSVILTDPAADQLLEDAGILKGYVALVDQARVGLPISVFASVKLERQREEELDRFAQAVSRWPEVVECYLMTGRHDYLVRVVVPDLAAYERFLKDKLTRLGGVGSIESSFALGQVKYTNVLPSKTGRIWSILGACEAAMFCNAARHWSNRISRGRWSRSYPASDSRRGALRRCCTCPAASAGSGDRRAYRARPGDPSMCRSARVADAAWRHHDAMIAVETASLRMDALHLGVRCFNCRQMHPDDLGLQDVTLRNDDGRGNLSRARVE